MLLLTWVLGIGVVGGAPATEHVWTLPEAIAFALENSPEARLAEERIRIAESILEQANASFWPKLQLASSYYRTDNPMQVFGAALNQESFGSGLDFNQVNDVPDADNLNVKGVVTYALYAGGSNRARQAMARADRAASREEALAVRNQVAFQVTRTFYTIHKTAAFIRAAQASVESFATNLVVAQRRQQAGTLLRAEVLDMEVQLAAARENLLQARHARDLALRALRNLLGMDQGSLEVSGPFPAVPFPDSLDFSGRYELQAASQRIVAAERQRDAARGGYRPQLDAFTSLDYDYGWEFDGSGTSYTAGLLLHWDLWDGRLNRGRVREAEARLEVAREEERRLRLAIDWEVEQARLRHGEAEERRHVTQKAVEAAAQSAQLTRLRFEQGLGLASQVIDAESALTAAEVRLAQAQADQRIALAALRQALGLPQLPETTANPTP